MAKTKEGGPSFVQNLSERVSEEVFIAQAKLENVVVGAIRNIGATLMQVIENRKERAALPKELDLYTDDLFLKLHTLEDVFNDFIDDDDLDLKQSFSTDIEQLSEFLQNWEEIESGSKITDVFRIIKRLEADLKNIHTQHRNNDGSDYIALYEAKGALSRFKEVFINVM
ncbi:hypothetical protein GF354_05265 [Candidatus Peregrinibacteria bacterium]|nr:hypothetical protein [Candidatus Peregrinibacteria bacterium]